MDYTTILGFVLQLADGLVKNISQTHAGQFTAEQIENAQAAVAKLQEFHSSAVTAAQLDSLKG